ncbi:AAA family ATPase [Amycolatopsis sp. cmx-4-83]|uniref:AAA family ATPase n=1 Tax=Amycolatopsis sp. cmx-4-83 TaxID=2790940 RepID=UPI0039781BAF
MAEETAGGLGEILDLVGAMKNTALPAGQTHGGDRRDGRVYAYSDEMVLALQVALITSRPLLLSGAPGCGKSSLASFVARNLGLAYHEYVVTDESSPQDLLWRMDVIRRLNDAQLGGLRKDELGRTSLLDYVEPGPLWWSINPASAARRNLPSDGDGHREVKLLSPPTPLPDHEPSRPGAVLLIDEIDKADSNFCNGLLVPLGSKQFSAPELDSVVQAGGDQPAHSPLVVITTNNEKELPEAFVRRCVALAIPEPTAQHLSATAKLHYPALADDPAARGKVDEIAGRFVAESVGIGASTAEFLDLVGTLLALDVDLSSERWRQIERLVVEKPAARHAMPARRRAR